MLASADAPSADPADVVVTVTTRRYDQPGGTVISERQGIATGNFDTAILDALAQRLHPWALAHCPPRRLDPAARRTSPRHPPVGVGPLRQNLNPEEARALIEEIAEDLPPAVVHIVSVPDPAVAMVAFTDREQAASYQSRLPAADLDSVEILTAAEHNHSSNRRG